MLPDDKAIVNGFLNGDGVAIDTVDGWIARAASPFQRRLATYWDDVLQAARTEITRLLRQGAFRGESSLKTYLWQVVNHTCINQLRARSRAPAVDLESLIEQPASAEGSPLEKVLQKEEQNIFLSVLEEMPAGCRELWGMILAGLSYREMSLRQGISEGALRVRVLRCRKGALAVRARLMAGAAGGTTAL